MLRRTLGEALQNRHQQELCGKKTFNSTGSKPRVRRWDSMKLKGTGTLSMVQKQAADGRRSLTALRQMGLMLRMYKELQELNTRSPVL